VAEPQEGEHAGQNGTAQALEGDQYSLNGHALEFTIAPPRAQENGASPLVDRQVQSLREALDESERELAKVRAELETLAADHQEMVEQYRRREQERVSATLSTTAELRRRLAESEQQREALERRGQAALAEVREMVTVERETWRAENAGLAAELATLREALVARSVELTAAEARISRLRDMAGALRATSGVEIAQLRRELVEVEQHEIEWASRIADLERAEALYRAAFEMFMRETDAMTEMVRREAGALDAAIRAIHNSKVWRIKATVAKLLQAVRFRLGRVRRAT
jgi:chromosome segregation ATPase